MTIGQYIKEHQPLVYFKLMEFCGEKLSFSDVAKLMSHAAYKKVRGVIRQTRQ